MEKRKIAIIGGGASGLFLAAALQDGNNVALFERADRVGKKLSATGNGQGNITNLAASQTAYFSLSEQDARRAENIIQSYPPEALIDFFEKLGVVLSADERGRVYPTGRQASALTDALRFTVAEKGVDVRLSTQITGLRKTQGGFILTANGEELFAEKVVLCTGGKAAKNFGTDGTAYALAQSFGHTVTPLYPSLIQIKTDTRYTKSLKGIRVADGGLTANCNGQKVSLCGDILFTDYGISGDAVFRISAFIAHLLPFNEVSLSIDFLPKCSEEKIYAALCQKRVAFPTLAEAELLFGVVNNQVGRAVCKRAGGDLKKIARLVKDFPLTACGSLGFDYAQVTKGGIPLLETDENLQSRLADGLYFAGEILDIDGQCGGFNLQWAFSSAMRVAEALHE